MMYDQLAADYDRFVNWEERLKVELPFIEKILETVTLKTGQTLKVLDAACGTGRHALALAKKGMEIAGADLSGEMVDAARSNAQKEGLPLRFEQAGFGELTSKFGEEQFDAVLCLGNSLPHLMHETQLAAALLDFYACLKKGGLLLIQNRNFDAVMETRDRWMPPQAFQEGERQWVFQRFYDFEPDSSIRFNMVTLTRSGGSAWESRVTSTTLRPLLRKELEAAVRSAGFKRLCSFGNLMGETFQPKISGNLVLICRK